MKWKTIIVSFSIVVTIGLIITLSVYYGTDFNVSEYNFYSNIERVLPSNDYLPIILEIENMSGESIYFETLNEEIRGHIENITKMIEKEQEFLQNHNPRECRDSYKSHTFNYTAILTFDFNRDYIEHLIENSIGNPTFYFYNNWSAMGYVAYSNYLGDYEGNFSTWKIEENLDLIFSMEEPPILIYQTMSAGDIWGPLAGTGTYFERLILCDSFGLPLLFITNEGQYWIS